MSSEIPRPHAKQSLAISGMSYRFRVRWDIPFKTFFKRLPNFREQNILERSPVVRIEGVKDLDFSLELSRDPDIVADPKFSLRVRPNPDPDHIKSPELLHAFADVEGETYWLELNSELPGAVARRPLRYATLHNTTSDAEEGGVKKSVSVHCLMRVRGVGDSRLSQRVEAADSTCVDVVDCALEPRTVEFRNAELCAYCYEGKVPSVRVESARSLLEEASEQGLTELKCLVSEQLKGQLTRGNVLEVMSIAIDNGMVDLQRASLHFIHANCVRGFV